MSGKANGGAYDRLDRIEGMIDALATRQIALTETVRDIAASMRDFAVSVRQVVDSLRKIVDTVAQLASAQMAMAEIVRDIADAQLRSEKEMAELREMQKGTDQRLNTLIGVFEELLRRQNGRS